MAKLVIQKVKTRKALFVTSSATGNQELTKIIKLYLAPHMDVVKQTMNKAIATTSSKLKAWATIKIEQAEKAGTSTQLYEKVLANPMGVATQIAHTLIGASTPTMQQTRTNQHRQSIPSTGIKQQQPIQGLFDGSDFSFLDFDDGKF